MAKDWSRAEVEAAVDDYIDMLKAERGGVPFNKTEHRRALATRLNGRNLDSVSLKCQNISAAFVDLRLPYLLGYRPLPNYQRKVREVVAERIQRDDDLHKVLTAEATRPIEVPTVADILGVLEDPPAVPKTKQSSRRKPVGLPRLRNGFDYAAMEAANRALGEAGEKFAVQYERARLLEARKERLAERVEHVAATKGDGAGFDVLSFETNGRERFIEVKTTAYGPAWPFYVTPNELAVSQERGEQYFVYRFSNFRAEPGLYQKAGPIDKGFTLSATEFVARLKG